MHRRNPHPHPQGKTERGQHRDQRRLGQNAGEQGNEWIGRRRQPSVRGQHVEDGGAEELKAEHLVSQVDGDDPTHGGQNDGPKHSDCLRFRHGLDLAADGDGEGRPDQWQERPVGDEDCLPDVEAGFAPPPFLSAGDNRVVGVGHAKRGADKLVEIGRAHASPWRG